MNILLPFDGKPHSQRAVDLAIKYFNLPRCTVTLLHVVEAPSSNMVMKDKTGRIEETYPEMAAEESQVLLEFLGKKFESAGAKVEIRIQHGKPGSEIKSLAESSQMPIILTTPGRHTQRDLMLDSTITNQLLQVEFEVLLMLARGVESELLSDDLKPACAFLIDGSDESIKCLNLLAPLVAGKMQILLVLSRLGWQRNVNAGVFEVHNPAIETSPARSCEEALEDAMTTLEVAGFDWEEMIVEESFEECVPTIEKHRALGMLVGTRSREDVLHRPLKGSPCERLFTSVSCNSALYCAAVS